MRQKFELMKRIKKLLQEGAKPRITASFRVDPDLNEAMRQRCSDLELKLSDVIEALIQDFLEDTEPAQRTRRKPK